MFKILHKDVWVFDSEWVPDPLSGRLLHGLPDTMTDEEVVREMWEKGGATEEDPTPFLKTVLCRLISISTVTRTVSAGETKLRLLSLPRDSKDPVQTSEAHIVKTFLQAIGNYKPQLVGYNSQGSDLRILIQRGIANGIQAEGFCRRPEKPWEGVDYFARGSDFNIDLMNIIGGWGKAAPSLHEMATVSRIPGKIAMDGNQVAPLWLKGGLDEIIAYNEFDALTTYLVWLRMGYFGGFFTPEQYEREQELVLELLTTESEKPERRHLKEYIHEWETLKSIN